MIVFAHDGQTISENKFLTHISIKIIYAYLPKLIPPVVSSNNSNLVKSAGGPEGAHFYIFYYFIYIYDKIQNGKLYMYGWPES